MSFKPEVQVSGNWERNGLVFATKEEAEASAQNLFHRWALTTGWRAVEVDEPANWKRDEDGVMRPILQEKANG